MIDGVDDEEFEIWRSQEVTERFVKEVHQRRKKALEQLAGMARSSRPEIDLRVAGGRIAGLDEVLELVIGKAKR